MTDLAVYAPGSRVQLGTTDDRFEAVVIAVEVRAHGVNYQCRWWQGRECKEAWLTPAELHAPAGPALVRLGFGAAPDQVQAPAPAADLAAELQQFYLQQRTAQTREGRGARRTDGKIAPE